MSYISNEYDDLVIAGLLHDIGKFYQRADSKQPIEFKDSKIDFGYSGAHSKWSSQFVIDKFGKDNAINNLILYHHNARDYTGNKNLINIITKSDSSSAYERNKEKDIERNPKKEPLISIFSQVNNNQNYEKYYMDLVELNLDYYQKLFAHKTKKEAVMEYTLEPKYRKLWNKFYKEFDLINNLNDIESILNLLKKYTLFIPSAVYKSEPDISLYDHLRTTAAITSARYNYLLDNGKITKTSDNKENYLVINASISGIQDFIYKINSPSNAQRGMAKRLRGRSFYLSLIMESIAYLMIKELNLKTPNLLYSSGGKFTILAHNSQKTLNKLQIIKDKINKFLIENFNSDIYFSLVYHETTDADFKNFGEITQILANKTNQDKKHKFIGQLEEIFESETDISYDKQCSVCGNLTNDNICHKCEEHQLLGTKLANSQYMIRYYSEKKIHESIYFDVLNIGYIFLKNDDHIISNIDNLSNNCEHIDLIRINDTNFLELSPKISANNISYSFKFIGNNVPEYDNENITFEEISYKATGANRLAIAKMDVDNLGLIFARGLKNQSISRIASLSFYLDIFFSGIINKIAEEYDVYINYSGGDDLLVIGAYDKIIEFSLQLRQEFKEYTCWNDSINISAGISVVKPKFPISKAIKFADDNLEKSKELGKNKITLFNETIGWQNSSYSKIYSLDKVISFSKQIEEYIKKNLLSKSFVYSLNIFKQQYYTNNKRVSSEIEYNAMIDDRIRNKKYIPLFKYKLRNVDDKNMFNFLDEKLSKEHYMPWIQIIFNWVMLRTR